MRVALVSLQYRETTTGGGGVHVGKVAENLVALGHRVTVLSIHTTGTLAAAGTLQDGDHPFSVEEREGVTLVRFLIEEGIQGPYEGTKHEELERIHQFCRVVRDWLVRRQGDFDVVHLHGHHLIPGWLARELQPYPFVVVSTVHYLESTLVRATREGLIHYHISNADLVRMKQWEAMSRYADGLVLISPGMVQDFIELLLELRLDPATVMPPYRIISSGIDGDSILPAEAVQARLASPPDRVEVVTFARLDPSKGIEYAIRAAAVAAQETSRPFRLTVAGIPLPEYMPILEAEAAKARAHVPVELIAFQRIFSPQERDQFLARFQLYLFPSLREPFGITIVEAGARGLMVVSTDAVGPRYILGEDGGKTTDWGIIAPRGVMGKRTQDPGAHLAHNLGRALAYALEDWEGGLRRAMALRDHVEATYTWRKVTEAYLDLYRQGKRTVHEPL